VLIGHEELGKRLGLRASKRWSFLNGSLPCWLLKIRVPLAAAPAAMRRSESAKMFENRLTKNLKHLKRWAKRIRTEAFRVYDADLPEYNVAIDVYGEHAVVQEYEAPPEIDPIKVAARFGDVLAVTPEVLGIDRQGLVVKVRRRRKAGEQYEKLDDAGETFMVHEGDLKFLVNLTDYLDTGLFLDHRKTRALITKLAQGKRFLNLFAYTGTATVAAAKGGATETTTVDMSRTYLDWARQNLEVNGVSGPAHELIQADCLQWLHEARGAYDLIFLDPPTYSASKRMQGTFDVQRDHVALIRQTVALLAPGGKLVFSCNFQRFKLDRVALTDLDVEEITPRTIDEDFSRQPRIHRCFMVARRAGS
jgi:23S rRNA (guanine2445-N2)-methyltransferase / 23S rRNA (guanine2069-N7)-methyltransferase